MTSSGRGGCEYPSLPVLRTGMEPELSLVENRLFCRAVQEACRLMACGDHGAGYRCLLSGYERVKIAAEAGESWAEDLAANYLSAMRTYCQLYSAPVERPRQGWELRQGKAERITPRTP